MTTWNDVVGKARQTARSLQQRDRKAVRYENSHGVAVEGWRVSDLGTASDPIVYRGTDYDETFANYYLILGVNGMLYQASLLHVEEGRRERDGFRVTVEKHPSVHQFHPQGLHPVENRRFRYEDIAAALDLLAQKSNSDLEPPPTKADKSETFSPYDKPVVPAKARPMPAQTEPTHATHPEPSNGSSGGSLLLMAIPFIALAVVVIILCLNGARFN